MVRRQTFAQRDGGIERCFVIGGLKFSAHAPSVRCISACGQRVLSDRLLEGKAENTRKRPCGSANWHNRQDVIRRPFAIMSARACYRSLHARPPGIAPIRARLSQPLDYAKLLPF